MLAHLIAGQTEMITRNSCPTQRRISRHTQKMIPERDATVTKATEIRRKQLWEFVPLIANSSSSPSIS